MMKKTYIVPQIQVVNMQANYSILAGSDIKGNAPGDVFGLSREEDLSYWEEEY